MVVAFTNEHSRGWTPEPAHYGIDHLFTPIPILVTYSYPTRHIGEELPRAASSSRIVNGARKQMPNRPSAKSSFSCPSPILGRR